MLSCLSTDSSSSSRLRGELHRDWNRGGDAGPPHPPDCGVEERDWPSKGALGVSEDGGKKHDGVMKPPCGAKGFWALN